MMFGTAKPLPKEVLKGLYGSLVEYRRLVAQSTDEAISKGFILAEDRQWMIDAVTEIAQRRGLD